MNISELRREYTRDGLKREHLRTNPFEQFKLWIEEACSTELMEPNAMSLATVDKNGRPSVRTVLLKHFDERGFVFYTNYQSAKAAHIVDNPRVAVVFPWLDLERQVLISGTAVKVPTPESLKYFEARPLGSRIGAWASPQSRVIASRKMLEMEFAAMKRKFADGKVPQPPFWGGYRVVPGAFEFWQGRINRLHDRFRYQKLEEGCLWRIERLAP